MGRTMGDDGEVAAVVIVDGEVRWWVVCRGDQKYESMEHGRRREKSIKWNLDRPGPLWQQGQAG